MISKDERIAYIVGDARDVVRASSTTDEANAIIDAAQPAVDAGIEVSAGGYLGQEVSKPSTQSSEAIGIGVAIVILLLAFGTVGGDDRCRSRPRSSA